MTPEERYKKGVYEKLRELKNVPPYTPNSIKISEIAKNNPVLFKKYCIEFINDGNFDYVIHNDNDTIYRLPSFHVFVSFFKSRDKPKLLNVSAFKSCVGYHFDNDMTIQVVFDERLNDLNDGKCNWTSEFTMNMY